LPCTLVTISTHISGNQSNPIITDSLTNPQNTANLSIALYEASEGDLKIPISLLLHPLKRLRGPQIASNGIYSMEPQVNTSKH